MSDTLVRPAAPLAPARQVHWGPVIAGALTAAALASVLHAFAAAVGLAVSSTAPTWRDASVALWILSGVYLVCVALVAYGVGGYVAGLLRERYDAATSNPTAVTTKTVALGVDEVELRDGLLGLLVWALATLLTVLLLVLAASDSTRLAASSTGAAGPGASLTGENVIAFDIDRLLRGDRRQGDDLTQTRAEAARILLTSSSHSGMAAEDRAYLVRLVAARSGLAQPEAERRLSADGERAIPGWLFGATYVGFWTLSGIPVYAGYVGASKLTMCCAWFTGAAPYLVAAVLVAAGLYQLTSLKRACLAQCESPLSFLMTRWRTGYRATFALATRHALYCIGCCWALMVILVVAGMMGIWWVTGIAVVVFAEKILPAGRRVATGVGFALIALGLVVAGVPDLLGRIR